MCAPTTWSSPPTLPIVRPNVSFPHLRMARAGSQTRCAIGGRRHPIGRGSDNDPVHGHDLPRLPSQHDLRRATRLAATLARRLTWTTGRSQVQTEDAEGPRVTSQKWDVELGQRLDIDSVSRTPSLKQSRTERNFPLSADAYHSFSRMGAMWGPAQQRCPFCGSTP